MRKLKFGVPLILCGIAAIGVFGFLTSALWNALMPAIFNLPRIGFWQALGLLVLSRILFGRMGGRGRGWKKGRFVRGWMNLSPEERERFKRAMRSHHTGQSGESDAAV